MSTHREHGQHQHGQHQQSQHQHGQHDDGRHRHGAPAQGNGHGHDHGRTEIDWEVMAAHLERNAELQLPALRRAAARLRDRLGPDREVRRILDIGSGPGVMTCVLAETFPGAEAVAVDGAPGLLDRALARAERLGLTGRVAVRHAELPAGLAAADVDADGPGTADLLWSSRAVHHLGDQQGALGALTELLRPGGLLAVAEGGLPMRYLPRDIGIGRPGLQARLDAAQEHWYDRMRAELPGSVAVVEDWPAMLRNAGLADVGSFTTLVDLPAPLDGPAREFLLSHLTRLRGAADDLLDAEDLGTLDLLIDPAAPEGVLLRPDAFLLSAVTVFTGVRPSG
ncbi:trans-aconitate 2-methyltransferase [Kitasatospora sp. MBT63]|uniref:class I SAM-dependent methyltransferase n=1 Tax=Kitasatospora sp. MBT63 TaxID=1444768 RepID=UPI00068BDCD7|nr:class I SAM-dependent methyltransferase [Kitasatospora sp. MBT63]